MNYRAFINLLVKPEGKIIIVNVGGLSLLIGGFVRQTKKNASKRATHTRAMDPHTLESDMLFMDDIISCLTSKKKKTPRDAAAKDAAPIPKKQSAAASESKSHNHIWLSQPVHLSSKAHWATWIHVRVLSTEFVEARDVGASWAIRRFGAFSRLLLINRFVLLIFRRFSVGGALTLLRRIFTIGCGIGRAGWAGCLFCFFVLFAD